MAKKPIELPRNDIIDYSRSADQIEKFIVGLKKGSIFGYSSMFSRKDIDKYAMRCGVKVGLVPINNPFREKYGEKVLQVIKPYNDHTKRMIKITAHFESIHCMERKLFPGNRKCAGQKCTHVIYSGEEFIEVTILKEIYTFGPSRKVYSKISLCNECGKILVKEKIMQLSKVLGLGDKKIDMMLNTYIT